jgi:hypothetical protein
MEGKVEVKGQRGKSEGERQVERLLRRCGLVYQYEQPLAVVDRGKLRLWHPDFFLPEYGIVIEYAGFNGEEYEAGLRHKKAVYREIGIPAIFVYPESFKGYWPARLLGEIEEIEARRAEKLARILERAG